MRCAPFILLGLLGFLLGGCTASDREYTRNHIVLLQPAQGTKKQAGAVAQRTAPPASALAALPASSK